MFQPGAWAPFSLTLILPPPHFPLPFCDTVLWRQTLLYSLARHNPEDWYEFPQATCTVLKLLSLLTSPEDQTEILQHCKLQEEIYTGMVFLWDFAVVQDPEAALSEQTHTAVSPSAKSWSGHTKAPPHFSLATKATGAGSPLIVPGPERGQATDLSHLPSTATKTWL